MLKRLAILSVVAFPLNIMNMDYIRASFWMTIAQCIVYFIYELSQLVKKDPQDIPMFVPVVFAIITSAQIGGRFIAWLMIILMPKNIYGDSEVLLSFSMYVLIGIILFLIAVRFINMGIKFYKKRNEK